MLCIIHVMLGWVTTLVALTIAMSCTLLCVCSIDGKGFDKSGCIIDGTLA